MKTKSLLQCITDSLSGGHRSIQHIVSESALALQALHIIFDCRSTVVRPSFDLRKFPLRLTALLALLLMLGVQGVWGTSYTITFKAGEMYIGTSITTDPATACSTIVSDGAGYLSGDVVTATKANYNGTGGLRIGDGSNAGTIKMNLASAGQLTNPTIIVKAKRYNTSIASTISANGADALGTSSQDAYHYYSFAISGTITYLQLDASKHLWIESVTVTDATCSGIDLRGGTSSIILPVGNTTYTAGDWGGAPTDYPESEITQRIGENFYCISFTQAKEDNNAAGLLLKEKVGVISISGIKSDAGVDVEIICSSTSGKFDIQWDDEDATQETAGTILTSTSSTDATLTIAKKTSSNGRIKTITITPRCAADPTIGDPRLDDITAGTISVTCPSIGAGAANCGINDYGFVWKAGSAPTIDDNKTQKGTNDQDEEFSDDLSISFSTGTTYYIKAYATNDGDNTTLSTTALTVTPQSITFNSNEGSSVSTIYVNNGSAAIQPSDPTKDGYAFEGWFSDNTLSSDVDWSSTISSNQTYYAKWAQLFTVTWIANGESYTSGAPSTVADGHKISTMPTPSIEDFCGDAFLGWTDAADGAYVDGTSNLYTTASEFPIASGNQTFYAVFADFEE